MLMSCLGRCDLEVESGTLELQQGDLILLSSDGLHDQVTEEHLAEILGKTKSLKARLNSLVEAALAAGGRDNITVVAAEL